MRYPDADLRTHKLPADPYTLRRIQQESYQQIAAVLAHASPHDHDAALDVGCGAGLDTFALACEFKHVIAIDLNRKDLRTARRIARECRLERVAFHRRDALAPAPDGPFDFVYCNAMSHGTRSRCDLIRNLVLATRPGGWLFISEECEGYGPLETEKAILKRDERTLRERIRQVLSGLLGLTSFRFFVSGTIEPLLASCGAVVMHSETYDWEGLPYLQRTWARRMDEMQWAHPAHPDYQIMPKRLRGLYDLCEPLAGRRLSPQERRLVRKAAESDDRLATLAMFLLMAEVVDPALSSRRLSIMTRFRGHVPTLWPRTRPSWPRLVELFTEFRGLVAG